MEKTRAEILTELKQTVAGLKSQLASLEKRIAELENEPEQEQTLIAPQMFDEGPIEIIDEKVLSKIVAETYADDAPAWKKDMPGMPVKNIISAISLNDRLQFVKTLFGEDASLFQETVSTLNGMQSFNEAEAYVLARFPGWKVSSDTVYRFMMAVRRKFQ